MLAVLALPQGLLGQRTIVGNRLVSPALPKATLEIAAELRYAGTQTFDLYGVATAEQHLFVALDGDRITRLLWVQFEGYHDSNSNTYNYRDSTITHSGQTWHRRINAVRVPETESRPQSDGARVRAFLRSKGWTLGPDILSERLVWLLDSPARNELMVIYMEDLAEQGYAAADLNEGGKGRAFWPGVAQTFHERALASFKVTGARP